MLDNLGASYALPTTKLAFLERAPPNLIQNTEQQAPYIDREMGRKYRGRKRGRRSRLLRGSRLWEI